MPPRRGTKFNLQLCLLCQNVLLEDSRHYTYTHTHKGKEKGNYEVMDMLISLTWRLFHTIRLLNIKLYTLNISIFNWQL